MTKAGFTGDADAMAKRLERTGRAAAGAAGRRAVARPPMPFTPFHLGPGLAVKAVLGRSISLMVFGFAQVAIDVEPLARILRGDAVVHGFTHTYVGATVVAAVSVVVGRPICQLLVSRWTPDPRTPWLRELSGSRVISWPAAIVGAVVGTYSHVFLDSFLHADMHPLAPFSEANALLYVIRVGPLHLLCIASGVLGALAWVALGRRRRPRQEAP